jgi:hypothetical protein
MAITMMAKKANRISIVNMIMSRRRCWTDEIARLGETHRDPNNRQF